MEEAFLKRRGPKTVPKPSKNQRSTQGKKRGPFKRIKFKSWESTTLRWDRPNPRFGRTPLGPPRPPLFPAG
jgi:hypothetical protein